MSKNVNVNGMVYSGVSQIQLNTTDGVTALFQDVDEIESGSAIANNFESGTFTGDGTNDVVIPVSSLKNCVYIRMVDIPEDAHSLPEHSLIIVIYDAVASQAASMRYWSGNSSNNGKQWAGAGSTFSNSNITFTESTITISQGPSVPSETFVSGAEYEWYAW